jgi:hypothetical protein
MIFPAQAWRTCLALSVLAAASGTLAQQKPVLRHFVAGTEERYQVTLNVKAESHSVSTETVATQTYVTPAVDVAQATIRWRAVRRIHTVHGDGTAEVEETVTTVGKPCEDSPAKASQDSSLRTSVNEFCAHWPAEQTIRYSENPRGLLQESAPPWFVQLGESAPPLLALWLRRAARPSVIEPPLDFAIGANAQHSFRPSGELLKDAHGSETTEWLDAPGETPAAMLHVLQQLSWTSPEPAQIASATVEPLQSNLSVVFFADSLTTLSLLDGSVLRASRTASRVTSRAVDPVPGLPTAPDFSSKLTLSITIERLP